jgi:hypothetical protein
MERESRALGKIPGAVVDMDVCVGQDTCYDLCSIEATADIARRGALLLLAP